ncbi:MAG TPA: Na+/H+ antiporter [Gemmatimonadaceae bacterium]|jgi:CPA1 family monovalent cation:H+ antiporter|nr:Na+/H+ antiporter [Gemmatimonadaceae bacterium]
MPDIRLILGVLAAVAVLAAIGRRFGIPDPIAFAVGGLVLALVPGIPIVALPPPLVLAVFLPPLIFAAAQDTSWAEIRREAWPIVLLAVGLVLVTMATVALVAHALAPELTWPAAFVLGAIVSPPDAVAAKAIADTLHLPRRLVTILSGEGLVNDATALLAFQVASGAAVAGTSFTLAPTAGRFLYTAAASVMIGLAAGWIGRHILDRIGDPAVENTVMLLLPFGAFLPAEAAHASGVLAVLTVALYLSRYNVVIASSTSRLQGPVLWEMIDFLLTGLSFVLVGLQLRSSARRLFEGGGTVLLVAAAVCVTVILVRPVWVFATGWLSHSVRSVFVERAALKPTTPVLTVVSWAGMRGVISLAVALSLPLTTHTGEPFPGRDLIVFITFTVILVTLVGQGLTLPLIIRRLGVEAVAGQAEGQELVAQSHMARAALRELDARAAEVGSSPIVVERVRASYAGRLERLEQLRTTRASSSAIRAEVARSNESTRQLLDTLIDVERAELQRMQNDAIIDGETTRRLSTELDLRRQ